MKYNKVVTSWFEINFETSHRFLGEKIASFLNESPDVDDWEGCHSILRDWEGDFNGIEIYSSDSTDVLIKWICNKLDVDYIELQGLNFKLVGM